MQEIEPRKSWYYPPTFTVTGEEISLFCKSTNEPNHPDLHPPIIPGLQLEMLALRFAEEFFQDKFYCIANKSRQLSFRFEKPLIEDEKLKIELISDEKVSNLELNIFGENQKGLSCKLEELKNPLEMIKEFAESLKKKPNYIMHPFPISEEDVNKFAESLKQDQNPVYKFILSNVSNIINKYAEQRKLTADESKYYIYSLYKIKIKPKILQKGIGKIVYWILGPKQGEVSGSYKIFVNDYRGDCLSKIYLRLGEATKAMAEHIDELIKNYREKQTKS